MPSELFGRFGFDSGVSSFCTMAKYRYLKIRRRSPAVDVMSLFDRENIDYLEAATLAAPSPVRTANPITPANASVPPGEPDIKRIFESCKIEDTDNAWRKGEINFNIIDRGRMRIRIAEWLHIIDTCRCTALEDRVQKEFRLNVLRHPSGVRLIHVCYRFKQGAGKQEERRCGLLASEAVTTEYLMRLAYWLIAQPHASKNFSLLKALADEAATKLQNVSAPVGPTPSKAAT